MPLSGTPVIRHMGTTLRANLSNEEERTVDTSERQAVNAKGYAVATTAHMEPGQLAAFDQAIAGYREACHAFAYMTEAYMNGTVTPREAEAHLRRVGLDPATGLITLPVAAVHFTDIRADGARMSAVNGSILGGWTWICWSGRCFRFGTESAEYDAYDLIQVKA